jgi:hypothetical protein
MKTDLTELVTDQQAAREALELIDISHPITIKSKDERKAGWVRCSIETIVIENGKLTIVTD